LLLFVLASCSKPTSSTSFTLSDTSFNFEGPIYSGPNSASVSVKFQVKDHLPANASLKSVSIKNASITADSSSQWKNDLQSIALQIGSNSSPMLSIGIKNPLDDADSQTLKLATETALLPYFNEKSFYLLLDADFINDLEIDTYTLLGNFTFELTYTQN
jgi:hypothetical protein